MIGTPQPATPPLQRYGGIVPMPWTPDLGVVLSVLPVAAVDSGTDEYGKASDEFSEVGQRSSYLLDIDLITRAGRLTRVPYLMPALSGVSVSGAIPVQGQGVLILYVGANRGPVAVGGYSLWRSLRRGIADDRFPELKPGEVIDQAAIRTDPMSWFQEPDDNTPGATGEGTLGARVYQDFKGRLILESRHLRVGGDGAFTRIILGNPAASQTDDEANDFNEKDASTDSYIALQATVAPNETSDPLFVLNVTQDGKVALEFKHGWIGRAPGETETPDTTVEIDVENRRLIFDGELIQQGRDANESAVLGDTLVQLLSDLIDAITGMRQPVGGAGPTAGPPTNLQTFLHLKQSLPDALSETNQVE